MQESRSSAVNRSLPNSIFEKFEHIYNEEDHQLKQNDKARKILLAQIMERQQRINSQKKEMQRQFTDRQNKEVDLFWKNEQERLRAIERRRKQEIQEARRVNNMSFNEILSKSMNSDSYHLQKNYRDDLIAFEQKERLKKQQAMRFYEQGMLAEQARIEKKQYDRELDLIIAQQKQKEDKQLNCRREGYFANWRNKHFQEKHPNTVRLVSQLNQKNQIEKAQLQEMIAVKGGQELSQRVAVLRGQQLEEKQAKKEDHTRQIKNQIEENTYKAAIDRYLELNNQRKRMAEMAKMLEQRDMKQKQQRKELSNEHLSVLKNQFKPRVLAQQPDKIEPAGIGSPAHIGKIVHDDRIKQLKYIERSYLQELNHL